MAYDLVPRLESIPEISERANDSVLNSVQRITLSQTAAAGERQKALEIYLKGHPELTRFAHDSDQAVFCIKVDRLELNHFDRG